jgi:NAD(P)-dependent dehydrogenase (short-subunit alcohol dehydrogenase family)
VSAVPHGAVLVTGASTGIGRATAERLAGRGIPVLAGVRRGEDGAALAATPGIEPLILDVTRADHVAALRARLAGGVLRGLVNNAGVAVPGPLEELPLDELRRQYEVNLFGALAVTQAALPALRPARGRIVNVGSIGGRVGQAFVGAYCGSKAALRMTSAVLRRELSPWGIWVACVEPGAIATEIWSKGDAASADLVSGLSDEGRALYGRRMERMRSLAGRQASHAITTDKVAERIDHALSARRPRAYYLVGPDAHVADTLQRVLPVRAMDGVMSRMLGV